MSALKVFCTVFLTTITIMAHSQVTFIVQSLPQNTPAGDNLYIAGDFTNWQPGQPEFMMYKNAEDKWQITLEARPDGSTIQFKFTRGSWETVEKGASGEEIPNRTFTFGNGDTVNINILNWAAGSNQSTAASNVEIMDEAFFMPQFNRNRRIWIYYPPDYETSGKNYPVLYMHDGQNLFDQLTSFAGEWEVDESLNDLFDKGYTVPIVVGIDNGGGNRIGEYTPWVNPNYGGGDGEKYLQFLVETLKPYIDQNFRTLPDRENTGVMGSSLGGLISHFGAFQYPEVFGKVGIFSPSYWFSDSVWNFTASALTGDWLRVYQMCGTAEGSNTDVNMLRMSDSLIAAGLPSSNIKNKVVPGGQHNEALWRQNFREAFLWLFEGENAGIPKPIDISPVTCFPNPAKDKISLRISAGIEADSVNIFDMAGQLVFSLDYTSGQALNISSLTSGTYLLQIITIFGNYSLTFVKE